MIKVNYIVDEELKKWYWKMISQKINRRIDHDKTEEIWKNRLSDSQILYDILFEELPYLISKYSWVQEYLDKCQNNDCKTENTIILRYINKKLLTKKLSLELIDRMNVWVCPYCNQQYVYAVHFENDGRYLGDLDHVIPKSQYPLFALSLWNLVPACKSCNQVFKSRHKEEILSPVEDGFGEDCIFKINFHSIDAIKGASLDFDVEWDNRAEKTEKKNKIGNNIALFKLNKIYGVHKREIQFILWKKYIYSNKQYLDSLRSMVSDIGKIRMDEFCYGIDLSEEKLGEHPHAKMIHDIVKYN